MGWRVGDSYTANRCVSERESSLSNFAIEQKTGCVSQQGAATATATPTTPVTATATANLTIGEKERDLNDNAYNSEKFTCPSPTMLLFLTFFCHYKYSKFGMRS